MGIPGSRRIAASYVALFLIGSGICVGYEAIYAWNSLVPAPEWYTFVIALVCIVVNEGLFRYSMSVARSTGSKSVEASAWDKRLDVFASLVVLLGLAVTLCAGPEWHAVDHIAALIVGCVILFTGGSLFWSSLQELMDRQASPVVLAQIRSMALTVSGVHGVDKLHVRKAGLEYFVDIHIEVDPGISVTEGHDDRPCGEGSSCERDHCGQRRVGSYRACTRRRESFRLMHLLHRHGRPSRSVKESQLLSFPFGSSPWISDKKPPSYPTLLARCASLTACSTSGSCASTMRSRAISASASSLR